VPPHDHFHVHMAFTVRSNRSGARITASRLTQREAKINDCAGLSCWRAAGHHERCRAPAD
jgi:hypothetical protein